MNRFKLMKNNRTYFFAFVLAIITMSVFARATYVTGDLAVGELPVTAIYLCGKGTPVTSAMSFKGEPFDINVGLKLDYNGTILDDAMTLDSFADADLASKLFQTDGIDRTFSDSYTTSISGISTGDGMYQTLRLISEESFSQYAVLKDSTVYSFTLDEPLAKTINDTVNAAYPTLTYLNVTIGELYLTWVFDRAIIDNFFAEAKDSALYGEVITNYATNKEMITSMLDPIFGSTGIHDFVYAPVDVSDYAGDWSLAKENRAVLGLNASDSSFDNMTKTASLRNLMMGYIGWQITPKTTVNSVSAIENPNDILYGFKATEDTYSVKMNVLSDFTGSGLVWNISLICDIFGLASDVGPSLVKAYAWFLVIGVGVGVFVLVVLLSLIFSKNKDKLKQHAAFGFLLGLVTSIVLLIVTTTTTIV